MRAAASTSAADAFASNVLPVIGQIRSAGATSLRAIAAALNARGVKTTRGCHWEAATLRNILKRFPQAKLVSGLDLETFEIKSHNVAKLAELIDGVAEALQVSPSRVRTAAAHLRKNKLLTTGPRGPGAPEMSPVDATNLLLAVMYDGELAEAHETVPRLREARLVRYQQRRFEEGADQIDARNGFLRTVEGELGELGHVLDTMLDWWVRYGNLAEGQEEGDDLSPMNLTFEISCPGYRGMLLFSDPCCAPWQLEYEWKSPEQVAYEAQNKGRFAARWDARNGPHIWSSRSVGEDCLYKIADCLRGTKWLDEWETFSPPYDVAVDSKLETEAA